MLEIRVQSDADLLDMTHLPQDEIEQLAREALLVCLFQQGVLSSGQGAKLLHMERFEFQRLVMKYGIALADESMDPLQESLIG